MDAIVVDLHSHNLTLTKAVNKAQKACCGSRSVLHRTAQF